MELLPTCLNVSIKEFELDEAICEYLSNKFGYCVNGFDFSIDNNRVSIKNIDWDTAE